MRNFTLVLAITSAICSFPAFAAQSAQPTLKESLAKVQNDCQVDVSKLCTTVPNDQSHQIECLVEKRVDITPTCKAALQQADAAASRAVDKADVAFRKDCGADVQKFCADVPSGKGRLLGCLDDHRDQLSKSCVAFEDKLQQKLKEVSSAG